MQVTVTGFYCASQLAVSHRSTPGHWGTSNLYKTQPVSEQHLSSYGARHFKVWKVAEGSDLREGREYGLARSLASPLGCTEDHKPATGLAGVTGPPHIGPYEPSPQHCTVMHQLKGE